MYRARLSWRASNQRAQILLRWVRRRAGAGEGNALEVFLALGVGIIIRPIDHTGSDAVHRHFGRELARQTQREVPQRRLAGAITEILRPRTLGEKIEHVDHVTLG